MSFTKSIQMLHSQLTSLAGWIITPDIVVEVQKLEDVDPMCITCAFLICSQAGDYARHGLLGLFYLS